MKTGWFLSAALTTVVVQSSSALACPFCESETGQQVRAGILNADFCGNLLLTLLPFPVFLAIIALIHFGLPWPRTVSRQGTRTAPETIRPAMTTALECD
jgi:hypothetical protein